MRHEPPPYHIKLLASRDALKLRGRQELHFHGLQCLELIDLERLHASLHRGPVRLATA